MAEDAPSLGRELGESAAAACALQGVAVLLRSIGLPEDAARRVVKMAHAWVSSAAAWRTAVALLAQADGAAGDAAVLAAWRQRCTPPRLTLQLHCELGYYAWDIYSDLARAVSRRGLSPLAAGFLLHHIVPLSAVAGLRWRHRRSTLATETVIACGLTANATTVVQHLLWLAEWRWGAAVRRRLLYRVTHLLFVLAFIGLRFGGLAWMLRLFADRWARGVLAEGGSVPPTVPRQLLAAMPKKCVAGTTVLTCLNALWVVLNVRKAAAMWAGPTLA
eukprot:TRINITY_DN15841_c0_g1_i1.p2 TRINITY_DN15841_c0_g1~~TRINITY_DN15841_c0_g1_i1.p2  ORF type:complete len:275 (+),score=53.39 TRINITY_DN15841_c0_g1_i1:102-926(+)